MNETIRIDLIPLEALERVAPVLRAAAHPLRLRLLDFLDRVGEPRTVSELIEICGAEQAIVSQQLRILKDQGLLSCRRDGQFVRYGLADPSVAHLLACIRSRYPA
jgi:ArsR family transcriptional regulator